jgi:hypothetical protein
LRVRSKRFLENLLRRVIGQRAQRQHRLPRAHTRFELFADTLSFVVGLWTEDRLRCDRTLHVVYGLMEQTETWTGCGRHLERVLSPLFVANPYRLINPR